MNRRDQPPTSDSRAILLTHATSIPCKRLPHSCPPQSYAEPEICQHIIETREVRDPYRSCKQKQKKMYLSYCRRGYLERNVIENTFSYAYLENFVFANQ